MKDIRENMKSLGKIMLVMYGLTAVLLCLLAVLMRHFQMESKAVTAGICAVYLLSCFPGGFFAGKVQKSRKFLWGLFMGLGYIVIMSGITLLVKRGFSPGMSGFFLNLLLCLGGGMLGGMLS